MGFASTPTSTEKTGSKSPASPRRREVRAGTAGNGETLTIIDYSRPSTEKRLWVFDLRAQALIFEELVAHGSGRGENFATVFSNEPEARATSLGLFLTEDTYVGRNGYSLRLAGLEKGWNDQARERTIGVHGAPYVSVEFARRQGRLGRSWGCPALPAGVARSVIDRIKEGGLVFAYYPDRAWLGSSQFLSGCAPSSTLEPLTTAGRRVRSQPSEKDGRSGHRPS